MKKNILGLDYIRGVSAVLVMLYHYTTRYMDSNMIAGAEVMHKGLWWGCWAVSVFFMLSGYLTYITVSENTLPMEFIKKRVIRLYPPYWFAVFSTSIVMFFFSKENFIGLKNILINCTMLQGFLGVPNVDGAYWTLRYELMFYIIIAAVLFIGFYKYINQLSAFYLAALIVIDIVNAWSPMPIPHVANVILNLLFISEQGHIFLLGMALAAALGSRKSVLPYINIVLCLIINFERRGIRHELFVAAAAALIVLSVKTNFRFKYDLPFVTLAAISYPLYLLHQKIGFVIITGLRRQIGYPLSACIAAVSMVAAAWIVHKFIEAPVSALLRKKLLKNKPGSEAAA